MLPQHLAGIVLENVIIHNILYYIMFVFILDVYFIIFSGFIILCFILFHFDQQMLLLFIVLVVDGKTNYCLFILFTFIILYCHTY